MLSSSTGDPLGYVEELREALDNPELRCLVETLPPLSRALRKPLDPVSASGEEVSASPDELNEVDLLELKHFFHDQTGWEYLKTISRNEFLCEAAYAVVRYLGYCRLYGIELPTDVNMRITERLLLYLFVPASVELIRRIKFAISSAKELSARFDDAEPLEDIKLCTSALHLLMQIWAATLALEEGYRFYLTKTCDTESKLAQQFDRVLEQVHSLDSVLQQGESIRLLSVATSLPLLENWRLMLAAPFREQSPWWLDGRLEEAAREIEHEIDTSFPLNPTVVQDYSSRLPFSSSKRPRSGKAKSLAAIRGRQSGLAAASGLSALSRERREAVEREKYEVEGDTSIRFHLRVDVNETGQWLSLGLWLTPAQPTVNWGEVVARYDRARLRVPDVPDPIELKLRKTNATFTPSSDLAERFKDWIDKIEIDLIDSKGNLHRVRLD